jgi:hypothetical protein
MGDCDTDRAFCDNGRCVTKRPLGEMCTNANQCASNACNNNVCCPPGVECCMNVSDCDMGLDARCDRGRPNECQGSIRPPTCQANRCVYGQERADDDRACMSGRNGCGAFKDIMCNGESDQRPCEVLCMNLTPAESTAKCDSGNVCAMVGGQNICVPPTSGGGGTGGGSGNPGNGDGNGNGDDD